MSWAAIVGQPLAVRQLRQTIGSGKMAHAYLFVGPEGVGKRTVALQVAKVLNCHAPGPEGDACGVCSSCKRIDAVPPAHPDVALIQPDGRFIKTDQIRDLQAEMYARPNEGKVRVAIIDGADRMNPESGNRLLKLLEEPPAYAKLILLTSNLSGVLPTLISRCQTINFPPISPHEVAAVLARLAQLDAGKARLFASLSGGSIGRAMRMAQDEGVAQRRDATGALLAKLSNLDDFALLGEAEGLEKQKEHLDDWLELATVWLRDALLVAESAPAGLLINQDRQAEVCALAEQFGPDGLLAMLGVLTDARGQLQKNANTRLALDMMLLHLGEHARAPRAT
ncbi:MAG TPA: DNA polymerase III subunit delta' [Symbiobacteriaceae bacterium]